MPSADNPLVLQICPDGFPAHLLQTAVGDPRAAHHAHGAHPMQGADSDDPTPTPAAPAHQHKSASAEHCLFGAGLSGVGPLSQPSGVPSIVLPLEPVLLASTVPASTLQRYRIQQPRAPPQLS